MSLTKTVFVVLPNEVIYSIFEYLTVADILQSFTLIQRRYDDLIRFYIKRVDLTNDWKGNRREFEWISGVIRSLKVDRYHIELLYHNQFPQLRSLHLVNISKWIRIISNMNLQTLILWFDENHHSSPDQERLPHTITWFFSNLVHRSDIFHSNLIQLNISIAFMIDLIEIIEYTPNVEYLSVTFAKHFDSVDNKSDFMTRKFRRLNKLKKVCFTTKDVKNTDNNEYFPFNQIEVFVDRCCPNETKLKRMAMQFHRIKYTREIWLTINRYKNTFSRFDFYGSFIVDEADLNNINISFDDDKFNYYIEGNILLDPDNSYVHIYSLPFTFDKIYGFTSCDELSSRTSYVSVRHLYFTEKRLDDRYVCFKFLSERMPYLTSIDCIATFFHGGENSSIPVLIIDQGIFHHVYSLRFKSYCCDKYCICRNVLPQLIDRMPNLRSLTTSDDSFIRGNHSLPPITQLDWPEYGFKSFEILIKCLPHLSKLALGDVKPYIGEISTIVSFLFKQLPSLKFLSFQFYPNSDNDRVYYQRMIKNSLPKIQYTNNRLHHLRLDSECEDIRFYLEN